MKRSQPKYFSDHLKIDKAKLKELGVSDPPLPWIAEEPIYCLFEGGVRNFLITF